ncbi:MAG: response regulator [Cyclobacteriaceae bacterium]|nr:response regulator [Cyclobacteriaceae bacterium HetDA_MAG_MS6]
MTQNWQRSIILILFLSSLASAQTFQFESIDRDQGLSHSLIVDIAQDHRGFMWYATQDGLVRYDGYKFDVYRPKPGDPDAIHDSWVVDLFVDASGRVWSRFESGGISIYDPRKEKFLTLLHSSTDSNTISDDYSPSRDVVSAKNSIVQSPDGYIWIATTNGLNRIHPETFAVKRFVQGLEIDGGLIGDIVTTLYVDGDYNMLWIGSENGLSRLNLKTQTLRHYRVKDGLSDPFIRFITKDENNVLWLGGRRSGLMRCQLDGSQNIVDTKAIFNQEDREYMLRNHNVYDMLVSKTGHIWVALEQGILLVDKDGNVLKHFLREHSDPNIFKLVEDPYGIVWGGGSSPDIGLIRMTEDGSEILEFSGRSNIHDGYVSNVINDLFIDKSGVLWVGTGKNGLLRHNLFRKQFDSYGENRFRAQSKGDTEVYSIYVTEQNEILVGSKLALSVFDQEGQLKDRYYLGNSKNTIIDNVPGVIEIIPGTDKVWVGYFEGKLSRYNLRTRRFRHFDQHDLLDSTSFHGWSLRDILITSTGTTYFGSMSGGLIYQKADEQFFRDFQGTELGEFLEPASILCLQEGAESRIWIGTSNAGVVVYNPKNDHYTQISRESQDLHISHNEVRCIYRQDQDVMWVGTRFGLNRVDLGTRESFSFFEEDGLPSNIIHGILQDSRDNLWISTNMGISKLNLQSLMFTNYVKQDGIQGNEFNEGAYFKDQDGFMYFGGVNGFTKFHPDSIKPDPRLPEIVLTDLYINQQRVKPGNSILDHVPTNVAIDYMESLTLPFTLNNFGFSFSTLDFRIPEKNRFRFQLIGLDDEWRYCKPGAFTASYGWVPAGEYILNIEASNLDGVWSGNIKKINITILPPWWSSWWFRLALIGLICVLIGIIFFSNIRRLTRQRGLLEEQVKVRTEEIMDANQQLQAQQVEMLDQNARLKEHQKELEQQQKNIQLLREMGQKITSSVELVDVFAQIYQIVNELVDVNELMVGTLDRAGEKLGIWGLKSFQEGFAQDQVSIEAVDRLSVHTVNNNHTIFSNNLYQTAQELLPAVNSKYAEETAAKSGIYMPLIGTGGKVMGVMIALNYRLDAYEKNDLHILENLASYISIAVDNASAYERIKLQSEQLKQIDHIKTDFYTNVSHEFRTPLSLIQGPIAELMKSGRQSPEDLKLLGITNRNAQLLLNLVEQIMELSKIEGGVMEMNLKESCLSDQLRNISESFRHLAIQKSIHYQSTVPDFKVRGVYDYNIINKISYNLLNNAIKYTPNGGEVSFEVRYKNETVVLVISDKGDGIPSEDLPHIFDRFYRGQLSRESREYGAGIGLALVKQLVELVHGKMMAESYYRGDFPDMSGTTFTVSIPIGKMEQTQEKPLIDAGLPVFSQQVDQNGTKINLEKADDLLKTKVLVVEDNEDLIDFLSGRLSEQFNVIIAVDGKDALEKVKKEQPQLVISDVMMPVMDGIDLCKELKGNIDTSHIPIILLTAKDSPEEQIRGLKAGANDYIVKPFDIIQLRIKVENILHNRLNLIDQFKKNVWTGVQEFGDEISPQDQEFLSRVKTIIEEQIQNTTLDIEYFCNELGVSRTWLYNKMKALLNMSMNDFIRNCRLKYAAKLLVTEKGSISQTAYAVGFNDPKYFTRCFKKEFGIGPKAYIKQLEARITS